MFLINKELCITQWSKETKFKNQFEKLIKIESSQVMHIQRDEEYLIIKTMLHGSTYIVPIDGAHRFSYSL